MVEADIPENTGIFTRLGLLWVYFRRGWGIFFTFLLVAITASGVAWDIVLPIIASVPELSWLGILFPNYGMFVLIGGGLVVSLAILLGWKDFTSKKGSWRAETAVNFRNNPEWVEMREELKATKTMLEELQMTFALYLVTRKEEDDE
jgi:hypothetical protein